jgi:hypothetical protein
VDTAAEVTQGSRPGRAAKDPQRSRVFNGSAVLSGVDGRLPYVRRLKEQIAQHTSDVPDASAAERSIIRRAAVLEVELEYLESRFATAGSAEPEDLDLYQRTASSLRRLLESIGLRRRAREVAVMPPPTTDHGRARASALRGRLVEGEVADDGCPCPICGADRVLVGTVHQCVRQSAGQGDVAPSRKASRNTPSRNAAVSRNEPKHSVTPGKRAIRAGRRPLGDQAMTPAERQRRARAARAALKAGEAKS